MNSEYFCEGINLWHQMSRARCETAAGVTDQFSLRQIMSVVIHCDVNEGVASLLATHTHTLVLALGVGREKQKGVTEADMSLMDHACME